MSKSILEIKMARRQKEIALSKIEALGKYKARQKEIRKLMRQIETGLLKHDREASNNGGHHWGHVGHLASIAETLTDLRDRLHTIGEYAD